MKIKKQKERKTEEERKERFFKKKEILGMGIKTVGFRDARESSRLEWKPCECRV